MERYSAAECCEMLLIYGECRRNARAAKALYAERFPGSLCPSSSTIRRVVQRLRTTGTVSPRPRTGRPRGSGVLVHDEAVVAHALLYPQISTREVSLACSLSQPRIWRILNQHGLHPYHAHLQQALYEGDRERRLDWCNYILDRIDAQPFFLHDILWTDEACFTRAGVINRRNSHFWALKNPRQTRDVRHQTRWSVTVWCGIWRNTIVGPVFFDGALTGVRYCDLLQDVLSDFFDDLPLSSRLLMWFQHDGAPPHKVLPVRDFLQRTFQERIIGYGGSVEWPPRSPDLTPMDFYLWGYVKSLVYATPPVDRNDLTQRIRDACQSISSRQLRKLPETVLRRIQTCVVADGGHFEYCE